MKRFGLRAKFLLLLSILLIFIFSIVALVLVRQSEASLRGDLERQSKSFASLSIKPIGDAFLLYKDSGHIRILQQMQKFLDLNPDVIQIDIVNTAGQNQFSSNDKSKIVSVLPELAASFEPKYIFNDNHELTQIIQPYSEDFGAHRYSMVFLISNQRVNDRVAQVAKVILLISIAAFAVSLLLAYLLINVFFLKPLRLVSVSALEISRGNFAKQIEVRRDDEIGDLANAVDKMASSLKADIEKLQESDKLKNEFLMITSHNLRTPLSIMSGYLEMSKGMVLSEPVKKLINTISANMVRLNTFAEDVLTVSTLESGQLVITKERTALRPVIDQVAKEFELLAPQKKLVFIYQNDLKDEAANISKPHFRSALWNLLDNSYKFTPETGQIILHTTLVDGQIEISINDTGIGIEPQEIPRLFTKFHRGTSTLKYDYEGIGIGLYLTKLIIDHHQGHIKVESSVNKGSTFTIVLPPAS